MNANRPSKKTRMSIEGFILILQTNQFSKCVVARRANYGCRDQAVFVDDKGMRYIIDTIICGNVSFVPIGREGVTAVVKLISNFADVRCRSVFRIDVDLNQFDVFNLILFKFIMQFLIFGEFCVTSWTTVDPETDDDMLTSIVRECNAVSLLVD